MSFRAVAVIALSTVAGCTLIVDSSGLTDRFGELEDIGVDSAVDSTVDSLVVDAAEAAVDTVVSDTRPPNPPDTSECTSVAHAGHTYLRCDSFGNWNKARTVCLAFGAYHLAVIEDAAEQAVVDALLAGKGDAWIGLADDIDEGMYRWSTGASLAGYTNWAGGEPSGADAGWEDCVAMAPNGFWYDHDCAANYNYILCESK